MSSRPEEVRPGDKRNRWSYPAKLTLLHASAIIFGMAALSVALWFNLERKLDAEWEADLSAVMACWRDNTDMDDVQVAAAVVRLEATSTVVLGPDTNAIFTSTFLWCAVPTLVFALLAGFVLMERAGRPLLRLRDTVAAVLKTGEMGRRVPAGRSGPIVHDMIQLFNQMLARIDSLLSGMHDALDNVAHDLRTPLTRLRAVAEQGLQASGDAQARTDAQTEALSDCMEESEHVLTMLTTLMDVAEAEAGSMRLRREQVDLSELLGGVSELYEMVADEKGVKLETDLPPALTVSVDPGRMRQVSANLVDNAIKYTPQGGTVRVSVAREGDEVVLRVSDDGMGIPPGDLPRIWDRLYRADRSRSEHGLGLGLSFVRAIVEAHGGTAAVESVVNQGSTFLVRLPVGES